MKKRFFFLGIFFIFSLASIFADRQGYEIKNFKYKATYHSDNTISVWETIDVNFTEARHGIYQSFYDDFYLNVAPAGKDEDVRYYKYKINNLSAQGEDFSVNHEDGLYTIKIGSASSFVNGRHIYNISYTCQIPDDRYDAADFIYCTVLGDQWSVPIDHFEFELTFENGLPALSDFAIYSGAYGSYKNALDIIAQKDGNTIYGEADFVQGGNSITIFSRLYEGYFTNERQANNFLLSWIFWALSFAFVIFQAFAILKTHHKTVIPTVEFYPPDGISSAEVGTIVDNCADQKDLASLVPWFASKGYLTIEQTDKTVVVKKVKDLEEGAPLYQKKFFNALFSASDTMAFDNAPASFYNDYTAARSALTAEFTGEKVLYKNKKVAIFSLLANFLLTMLFLMDNSPVESFYNIEQFVPSAISLVLGILATLFVNKKTFFKGKFLRGMIFISLFQALNFVFATVSILNSEVVVPKNISVCTLALSFLVSLFEFRRIVKSDWNVEISGKLVGLKQFIKTAEIDQLKMLVDENPEYFYKVLPYAMVFDLTDKWTNLFKDIDMQKPDWYQDSRAVKNTFNYYPLMMASCLNSINGGISSEITRHVASQSKSFAGGSSSFGGGGFSGGGAGGGGGGSW